MAGTPSSRGSEAPRAAAEEQPGITIDEEMDLSEIAELACKIKQGAR